MADDKPIIVIKKKGGHGGHHGGAWKIAYADFVTAMMAFFMVMWLVNSADTATKKSVASYFRKPGIFQNGSGTPMEIGSSGILADSYAPPKPAERGDKKWELRKRIPDIKEEIEAEQNAQKAERGLSDVNYRDEKHEGMQVHDLPEQTTKEIPKIPEVEGKEDQIRGDLTKKYHHNLDVSQLNQKEVLEKIAETIKKTIASNPLLQELLGMVEVKVDADGLNIEIMDTEKASMFKSGSSVILPDAKAAFMKLTQILGNLPNAIEIVGHTDAKGFSTPGGYSNWELSADRANAARKVLIASGVKPEKIAGVIGRASTELRNKENPEAPANRRITLKMKFDMTAPTVDMSTGTPVVAPTIPEIKKPDAPQPVIAVATPEPVRSFTTQDIIEGAKQKKNITLPSTESLETPIASPTKKNLIFDDAPVFSPGGIFSDP